MSQKLMQVLLVIMAILIAVLFYLQFKKDDCCNQPKAKTVSNDTTKSNNNEINIAFVNTDSLYEKYKFAIQLKDDLDAKQNQLEGDLESRGKALENEFKSAQERVALMTADEAKNTEERLMKKQQQLMVDRDKLSNQLLEFNANVNKQLADTITNFLELYNESAGYDFIFNYTSAAPVMLYKSEAHDITNEVIDALNKNWDKRKED